MSQDIIPRLKAAAADCAAAIAVIHNTPNVPAIPVLQSEAFWSDHVCGRLLLTEALLKEAEEEIERLRTHLLKLTIGYVGESYPHLPLGKVPDCG